MRLHALLCCGAPLQALQPEGAPAAAADGQADSARKPRSRKEPNAGRRLARGAGGGGRGGAAALVAATGPRSAARATADSPSEKRPAGTFNGSGGGGSRSSRQGSSVSGQRVQAACCALSSVAGSVASADSQRGPTAGDAARSRGPPPTPFCAISAQLLAGASFEGPPMLAARVTPAPPGQGGPRRSAGAPPSVTTTAEGGEALAAAARLRGCDANGGGDDEAAGSAAVFDLLARQESLDTLGRSGSGLPPYEDLLLLGAARAPRAILQPVASSP